MLGYGRPSVSNCIVWDNTGAAEIHGGLVTYSCVKGGCAGTGNIAADPALIDPANADFHLSYGSPCRDNGSNATTTSTNDNDGDPRIADGTVDMGADEFFPHLYHVGTPTPGGTIDVKLIGKPSDPAFWAYSTATLVPPASIPGLHGLLQLEPGNLVVIPIGPVPTAGVISFPVAFPPGFPRISIPTQALMGLQLSNLEIVHVR
jgi:hypothetical protein